MNRRSFIKTAGGVTAMAAISPATLPADSSAAGPVTGAAAPAPSASIKVEGDRMLIETHTLSASMTKGFLTSLRNKVTGEDLIQAPDPKESAALELVYRGDEIVRVDESKFGTTTVHALSPTRAEFVFQSWDGDGIIAVEADPISGAILVEPSAFSARPGVRGTRWNIPGLRPDLKLVAPFFQGVRLSLDDSLIRNTHWAWPFSWEAGLVILESQRGGFWVHTQDSRYRYKAVKVGSPTQANRLGLDTEAYGPIDQNLGAGGLVWRINVFDGDWTRPAGEYKDWLWRAYDLKIAEAQRPPWIHDVRFALSWCPGSDDLLDALARRFDPPHVLIHFPNWRSDPYDENYPAYVPSDSGRRFVSKARALGFRIMPHFNAIDMDPSHPAYAYLRDFQYRGIDRQDLRGWSWHKGRGLGVPESNSTRSQHRDKKVMVKVHPGLGMWRSILGRNILEAAQDLSLEAVFIDVTLVSQNLHNCLVDGMTSTEGMHRIIRHVAGLGKGLVVGGEGLNEITMQGQSFAQAHLFKSWQESIAGLERSGGCDLNHRLFGRLCRTIGYSGLGGRNDNEALRMRMHLEHAAIPTVTIRSAEDIDRPNPAVLKMLEAAGARSTSP